MYNNSIPNYQTTMQRNNDRGPFLPFVVGGVAGTALGYGIANNNYISNQPRPPYPVPYPVPPCQMPAYYYPQRPPYYY